MVVVSLDGFRASYLSYNVTPHIQQLVVEGVHTPRLLPAYPSLTFPNHYTIATVSSRQSAAPPHPAADYHPNYIVGLFSVGLSPCLPTRYTIVSLSAVSGLQSTSLCRWHIHLEEDKVKLT